MKLVKLFLKKVYTSTINTQGQCMSFWCVIYVSTYILCNTINTDLSTSFQLLICSEYKQNLFLLITFIRKAVCTKCRCKRTIFLNKWELLKFCSYCKHFDQIHHNIIIRVNVFGGSVNRIKNKIGSWLLWSRIDWLWTDLVHLLVFRRLQKLQDLQ